MNWINLKALGVTLIILFSINEFTLVHFDQYPPLSDDAVQTIRFFDLFVALLGLSFNFFRGQIPLIKKLTGSITTNAVPSLFAVIILDLVLGFIGFGYPVQNEQSKFPSPGDSLVGKPSVNDHNQFGFRGDFVATDELSSGTLSIAFFGGSTGYHGNPPIVEIIADKFANQGQKVVTYNFSSSASNHSQHVHRFLKFYDQYSFDIVIFYGGGNESMQYSSYDPRPGYPYNFFFKNELTPFRQAVLRHSAIIGEIDKLTGLVSGLKALQIRVKDDQWVQDVINNYWRDMQVAKDITTKLVTPNRCSSPIFLGVMQPGNPFTAEQRKLWESLKSSTKNHENFDNFVDLTFLEDDVVFTDIIHVDQESRELIGSLLYNIVATLISERCE